MLLEDCTFFTCFSFLDARNHCMEHALLVCSSILFLMRNPELLKQLLLLTVLLIICDNTGRVLVALETLSDISTYLIDPGKRTEDIVLLSGRPVSHASLLKLPDCDTFI